MALVFHDWFATSEGGVSKAQQMIDQSNLFRANCFGSFLDLFKAVTVDPAMLQWLNGDENNKGAPNENYAREMMELFSLGADRGAYTEDDIREQARVADRLDLRMVGRTRRPQLPLRSAPPRHRDRRPSSARPATGAGKTPAASASKTPYHPSFFVEKLWSYFVADAALGSDARTADGDLRLLRPADPPGARGNPHAAPTSTKARRW